MKVTKESINDLPVTIREKRLLNALLIDLKDINKFCPGIYIEYIDKHTEYSPEWTDPCPDYYGMYQLRHDKYDGEIIGIEMDIDLLDTSLCLLNNFVELCQKISL